MNYEEDTKKVLKGFEEEKENNSRIHHLHTFSNSVSDIIIEYSPRLMRFHSRHTTSLGDFVARLFASRFPKPTIQSKLT